MEEGVMTIKEKRDILIEWIFNMDEYALDDLINLYLDIYDKR